MKFRLRSILIVLLLLLVTSSFAQAAAQPALFEASVALGEGDDLTQFTVYPTAEHAPNFPDDPAFLMQVTPPDGQPYTFLFPSYERGEGGLVPLLRFPDMNGDGFLDVEAAFVMGASNLTTTYYLFDPTDGRLHYADMLGVLSNAVFDADRHIILSQISDGVATHYYSLFDVREGIPMLARTAVMDGTVQQGDELVLLTQVLSAVTGEVLLDERIPLGGDETAIRNAQYEKLMQTLLDGYGDGVTTREP